MHNLCIIPARGGSKRIPRKNIRDFLGKPIIAYSIEVALKSGLFEEVMVSTDDEEIAEISKKYGAKVPFMRSEKTSTDFATTIDVIKEVIASYHKLGLEYDYACCIYPTAPLIKTEHLNEGFIKLSEEKRDCVFPVVPFSYPIWRGLRIKNSLTEMIWKEYEKSRSQDLEPTYHDAGQWYWFKPDNIDSSLWTNNTSSVVLKEIEVQDIDNETDWKLAELKYELIQNLK
jgi:pseudaminic acid cytidylyltransferase